MKEFKGPDPKPPKRVRSSRVMRRLHIQGVRCVLCGEPGTLHHVYPKGQGGDDWECNLVGLCGDGTVGHHGLVEANDHDTLAALGAYLVANRPDTIIYIRQKLGHREGLAWLEWRYCVLTMAPSGESSLRPSTV